MDTLYKNCLFLCVSAQLMSNKGILFANDANAERAKAIVGNIHRMGIVNCVISTHDGRKLPKVNQYHITCSVNEAYCGAVMVMYLIHWRS